MIYLKFHVPADKDCPTNSFVTETEHYHVTKAHNVNGRMRIDIFDDKGVRHALGHSAEKGDWLNCFVMSDSGKTIDVIHAPHQDEPKETEHESSH